MALGTAFMALHANQGPRLGLPQMIQSRAQFGSLGAAIPLLVAVFIYLGFNVFQFIVTAEAIQVFLPGSRELLDRHLRRARGRCSLWSATTSCTSSSAGPAI